MRTASLFLLLAVLIVGSGCTTAKPPPTRTATAAFTPTPVPGPASQPRDMLTVQNERDTVQFAFWQDGRQVMPDKEGVVHLKHQPFEIRFVGSVGKVSLLALTTPKIADALDEAKVPVTTMSGMGAASDNDELLILDDEEIQTWEKFSAVFDKEDAAKYTQILQYKLHFLPVVLLPGWQPLYADDDAKEFTLKVKRLFKSDLMIVKELWLTVMVREPVDGEYVFHMKWRSLKLVFDQ
jgi:hypothetical protein